jgi:hypothetical protein
MQSCAWARKKGMQASCKESGGQSFQPVASSSAMVETLDCKVIRRFIDKIRAGLVIGIEVTALIGA